MLVLAVANSAADYLVASFPRGVHFVSARHAAVYPPLNVPKPIAPDLWIVDSGPLRAMGVDIPLRMTVVRLKSGALWLHSPTYYDERLRTELEKIGPILHLVAPNIAHWSFLKDWQAHCPGVTTWAARGLRQRSQVRKSGVALDFDLGADAPNAWANEIDQALVPGGFGVNEVAFLHRPTSTLLLTDLIENFEAEKVNPLLRPLVRLVGAMAPDGKAPAYLRFAIKRKRRPAALAAHRMVAWAPERVIFAHGRWFERDGTAQLKRSLRWLLD
jgi:hypothetical protein